MSRTSVLIAMVALAVGCAGRSWRVAKETHTGLAYRTFATENPDHPKFDLAMERAEALDWTDATALDTPEGYQAFLGAHPRSEHSTDAMVMAEARSWDRAREARTPEALSAFLARYPDSAQSEEARLLVEEAWYERAKSEATEAAWSRYLVRYPEGRWITEAQEQRERLAWMTTQAKNTRLAYEQFAMRFPFSEHRDAAMEWLHKSRVSRLQPVVVLDEAAVSEGQRATLVYDVRQEFDDTLVYDLRGDFRMRRTIMVDLKGGPAPHPQKAYGKQDDTGLLVLTYSESPGRRFEPSGRATDIVATLELYVPATTTPVWSERLEATTPERATGATEKALHDAALAELGSRLRGYADGLALERRETR